MHAIYSSEELSVRASLQPVYDAYLVFCENGSHRIAWRNLALFLTTYLKLYFLESPSGFLTVSSRPRPNSSRVEYLINFGIEQFGYSRLHPNPSRVEYLSNLEIAQLGYLAQDVLWVLFRTTGFIENDNELCGLQELHTKTREYIRTLSEHNLQVLLVDITNELNKRTPLTAYRHGKSIATISTGWSPIFGTDSGILHHLDVNLSPSVVTLLLRPHIKKDPEEPDPKLTFYDLPKKLLRRALSVGSGLQSKKPLNTERPVEDGIFGDSDPARVPPAYIKRLKPSAEISSTVIIKELPLSSDTRKKGFPRQTPLNVPLPLPDSRIDFFPKGLKPITEDAEERDSSQGDGCETLLPDTDSVATLETLKSRLDSYDQSYPFRNASSKTLVDASKRASIEVGELSRPEFQEQLCQAGRPFNDDSSIGKRSNQSAFSPRQSFVSARTLLSTNTTSRITKKSSIDSFFSIETTLSVNQDMTGHTAYWNMLKEHDLVPESTMETDWSGRGQHVEFDPKERDQIPLQVEMLLGKTQNALVESVRCKRIRLVRKLMRCSKWSGLKREDALREVQHLYQIQHSHIVRLVGTYVIGSDLAILTYPCAEWNLEQFMELTRTADDTAVERASLRQFFTCLAKVLDFMHSLPLKHMDIKPQNLLVRDIRNSTTNDADPFKIYLTDFGISRSYDSVEEAETENPTSFTRAYAALEVVLQESRGLSVDVFSLGCVFTEMLATLLDASASDKPSVADTTLTHWKALRAIRQRADMGVRPYYSANGQVRTWLSELPIHEPELHTVRNWIIKMLDSEPNKRPAARQIADDPRLPFACLNCTLRTGPEDFEAAKPLTPRHHPPHPTRAVIEVPKPP